MELQFHKSSINFIQPVLQQTQKQELTQEVRLTEGMPDVGKVIGVWGQILLRGKQWNNASAGVSGGVMAWVLYLPEDGTDPRSVSIWLPMQMKWDIPESERDGSICVVPGLHSMDARCVSARKIMVRATTSMKADAYVPSQKALYEPQELPEDLRVLKQNYPVYLPKEAGEKVFSLEETVQFPAESAPLEKILWYTLRPEITDKKVMTDKLIFRGNAHVHILYRGADGQIYKQHFEIPFSQYADLDREYDSTAEVEICLAVANLEIDQAEEEGVQIKAGLIAQYVVKERSMIDLVQDSYSSKRDVITNMEQLELPAILADTKQSIAVELSANSECLRIVDTMFYPGQCMVYREDDTASAELSGVYQILGYDAEGQLRCENHTWSGKCAMPTDRSCCVSLTAESIGKARAGVMGGTADMAADLQLHWQTTAQNGLPMMVGLELGEEKKPDANRPSLILRRAGDHSLWDLAKQTGTTVEEIQKINGLQQELLKDQMLLIPVP